MKNPLNILLSFCLLFTNIASINANSFTKVSELGSSPTLTFGSRLAPDTECAIISSPSSDRRPDKSSFKIMQYNVEWLFVDYYSEADCPGSQCTWKNQSEAITHLEYVANVIKEINPDIINLCEVEGCDELNMLSSDLTSGYISYLKQGADTATGQNAGMLTRIDPKVNLYRTDERYNYPIAGSKCGYTGAAGSSGVSKHYITEFEWYNTNVAFIGAHLLAYPTDAARCVQREAQAQILQNIIAGYIKKDYEIIIMGDFNDFDGEIIDANDNKPISQVLDIIKGNFGDFSGDYKLYSVAENIIKTSRYSDWWDSNDDCSSTPTEFSMIDHILVSDFLRNKISSAYFYHGYDEFCGKKNSDHYPLIIELDGNI